MNILFTSTGYPPSTGGAQLLHHQIAIELQRRHTVQVVCQWSENRTDWLLGTTILAPSEGVNFVIDNIPVHRIGLRWPEKLWMAPGVAAYYPAMLSSIPHLSNVLEKHIQPFAREADIVHNMRIGREALSYASLNIARNRSIPFVLTPVHHPRWVGWRYKAFIHLYRAADAVLALTESEKLVLEGLGVSESKIHVTGMAPNVASQANPERFRDKHNLRGPFVLFIGQHYQYKGYRALLASAEAVWQKAPDVEFVFIGPPIGSSERFFKNVVDRRVRRLGVVSLQEKTDALAACDVLCVPSTQESFGGVYTEAWYHGKPVIGCDIPAVSEVVSQGVDGYLVRQHPSEIASRILELLLDHSKAVTMGEAGRRKVQKRFTWQRIAARVESAYQVALTGRRTCAGL